MEEVRVACELMINYIESLLTSSNSKTIVLDFFRLENCLFLSTEYKEGSNRKITSKTKLNVDLEELSLFYQELFNKIIDSYVESQNIKVQMVKELDFSTNIPFICFRIHDRHLNEIDLRFRNLGHEKECLENIESEIVNLYNEKRASRKR